MKDLPKRTKKDEDEYIANLMREEPIKTDVIRALKEQVQALRQNQERTLTALLLAQQSLHIYRAQSLALTQEALRHNDPSTLHGISGVYWDNVDGWHRKDEGTK